MVHLVTGATGLVGNNVARELLAGGHSVRVLVRPNADPRPLAGLDVEQAAGDVCDAASVQRACQGVAVVVHCAGVVHMGWSQADRQRAVNVEGTRHVAVAARGAGARLVHVSSVDALGVGQPDAPADEDSPRTGKFPCPYAVTKRDAEAVVRGEIEHGLDAAIVNPGFMLGPWDWKPSSGRMLIEVARWFTPVAPSGGFSVCDVRDVAAAIVTAGQRAPAGRQYILAGENMTYFDLWCLIAEVTGGGKPWFRAGPVLRWLGGGFGDLWYRLTGREVDMNSAGVGLSSQYHYYSSARAEAELGYRRRPVRQSAADAWQWFLEHGYVRTRKRPANTR